jgi:hypothetical protein
MLDRFSSSIIAVAVAAGAAGAVIWAPVTRTQAPVCSPRDCGAPRTRGTSNGWRQSP